VPQKQRFVAEASPAAVRRGRDTVRGGVRDAET